MNHFLERKTSFLSLSCIIASAITAFLFLLVTNKIIAIDPGLFTAIRCFNVGLLVLFALKRRSLTVWILISIFAGAEFGYDLPEISKNLQFLSDIFIRLIKTIIAPLIFATLVNGIAGHNDLKLVGRLGWKSILYFEVVSTLALFIGLLAINISQAGVGLTLPPDASAPVTAAKAHSWSGFFAEHVSQKHCQIHFRRKHSAGGYF